MIERDDYLSRISRLSLKAKGTQDVRDAEKAYALMYYFMQDYGEMKPILKSSTVLKDICLDGIEQFDFNNLYWEILKMESPHLFDSYLLYLEKNREEKDKFYSPKRKQLQKIGLIQLYQDLEDDVLDIGGVSLPPSSGKTTCEKFFTTWVIGRHIDNYNLFYSHSGDICRMFYDGIYDITTSDEYCFNEIFPECKLQGTNAKRETINFGAYKPFASVQCTSVGSKNSGKVRCNGYLICDDMIGGIEEAMSPTYLEKLWQFYTVDGRQRKTDGCKELHTCTRWSVNDPVGRLERVYEGNERVKFLRVPDIDPETGESNFDYRINGFSVEFFNDIAHTMDDVSYRCLYKNDPIEREGRLYHPEEFERYYELPGEEPDAILCVCDTKDRGSDYCSMPVFYQYGDRYYLEDVVYDNNSAVEVIDRELVDMLVKHQPHMAQFESNSAGGRVADDVSKRIKDKGCRTKITKKYTTQNKETKIMVNAGWVKEHVLLKDSSQYKENSQYGRFIKDIFSYVIAGKNAHDDSVDSLAMFAEFRSKIARKPTRIIESPF